MAHGLLTDKEDEQAAAEGWGLYYIYVDKPGKWIVGMNPPTGKTFTPGTNVDRIIQFIVTNAKRGDALSLRALALMQAGVVKQGRKK